MNREILFRGKRVDNGEWVEGYLFDDGYQKPEHVFVGGLIIDEYEWTACDEWDINGIGFCDVEPNTVCQYTGLTGKNGKKIWEGDIIKYHFGEAYAPVKFGEYQNCFDSTSTCHVGFYVDWDKNHNFRKDLGYWIKLVDAEVVGNIFDNPELLEEENVHGAD